MVEARRQETFSFCEFFGNCEGGRVFSDRLINAFKGIINHGRESKQVCSFVVVVVVVVVKRGI